MIIAHQGSWDEAGLVVVPLLIIAALMAVANRRANRVATDRRKAIGAPGANEPSTEDANPKS